MSGEIPDDIMTTAREVLGDSWCAELGGTKGWLHRRDEIARAILAERERCAKIADAECNRIHSAGLAHPENSPSRDRCFARARTAHEIATAIRNRLARTAQ